MELRRLDVSVAEDWDSLLAEIAPDVIVHLAAETGTGQSLTEASRHANVNVVGTTQMLDALVRHEIRPDKIVLASSRAVYGEGKWIDAKGHPSYPGQRTHAMLEAGQWDFTGLTPSVQSSTEVKASPANVYAATKFCQENLVTSWCGSFGVTPVLYRLQNVYGPGQSLINPYTGIVSLFARLAKQGQSIPVYEDGQIVRDFVFIDDVASAIVAGVLHSPATSTPYDIGLGERTTIMQVAQAIAEHYAVPALIEFPDHPIAVSEASQTEQFFSGAFGQYDGVSTTHATIRIVAETGHSIWADVTWTHDAGVPSERLLYQLVRSGSDWRIAVLTPLDT